MPVEAPATPILPEIPSFQVIVPEVPFGHIPAETYGARKFFTFLNEIGQLYSSIDNILAIVPQSVYIPAPPAPEALPLPPVTQREFKFS